MCELQDQQWYSTALKWEVKEVTHSQGFTTEYSDKCTLSGVVLSLIIND